MTCAVRARSNTRTVPTRQSARLAGKNKRAAEDMEPSVGTEENPCEQVMKLHCLKIGEQRDLLACMRSVIVVQSVTSDLSSCPLLPHPVTQKRASTKQTAASEKRTSVAVVLDDDTLERPAVKHQ